MYKSFSIDLVDANGNIVVHPNKGEIVMVCIYFMPKPMFLSDEQNIAFNIINFQDNLLHRSHNDMQFWIKIDSSSVSCQFF